MQICRAKGLRCEQKQTKIRSAVSVEFRGNLLFTYPSENLKDPRFGDCFVFPIRVGDNKRSSISLKVLTILGEGEFEPGSGHKQETLAKAQLDVLKYTNDEAVHELVMLIPAHKPTDQISVSARLQGNKMPISKAQKTHLTQLDEIGAQVSNVVEQGISKPGNQKLRFLKQSKSLSPKNAQNNSLSPIE